LFPDNSIDELGCWQMQKVRKKDAIYISKVVIYN
jgi:hypothetical protein